MLNMSAGSYENVRHEPVQKLRLVLVFGVVLLACIGLGAAAASPQEPGPRKMSPESFVIGDAATKVASGADPDLRQARRNAFGAEFIQLNGIIGQRISYSGETLDMLDWKMTFLSPFQARADIRDGKKPKIYVGLGKNIEGLVYWAAYKGTPAALALKTRVMEAVIATQENDGYIGAFGPETRGRDATHDTHEGTYIMKALAADHRIFGTPASGLAAERLAAWWIRHWTDSGTPTWGMENCFLEFGEEKRDFRFADWILETHLPDQKYRVSRWGVPLAYNPKWDDYDLSGKHVYYYAASASAQLWLNQKHPNALLTRTAAVAEAWIKDGGATLPGTFGFSEKWSKNQFGRSGVYNPGYEHFSPDRDHKSGEVCSRVHVAELLDTLEQTSQPDAWRYDVIERIIYNSLFAAESVEARPEWGGPKIRYDTAVEGPRAWYWQQRYCCPGNFRRFLFAIPKMMYRGDSEGLHVNLYEDSEADLVWAERHWKTAQQTKYPRDGSIRFLPRPDRAVQATIHFRIPNWVSKPTLTVNGEAVAVVPGSYAAVTRVWNTDDVVELDLPMEWHWIAGYREQQGRSGLLRGPLVFTLNPAINGIQGYSDLDWEPRQFGEAIKDEPRGKYEAYEPSYQRLREIVIDPSSVTLPVPDKTVYPDGIAGIVKGWKDRGNVGRPYDLVLKLTEFPDERGRTISFRLSETSVAQPDPLFAAELKEDTLFPRLWAEANNAVDPSKLKTSEPKIASGATLVPALRSSYDEMTSEGEIGGRRAWMSVKDAARPYRKMGFRFQEDYRDRKPMAARMTVVYLDRGSCEVELLYDSTDISWRAVEKRPDVVGELRRTRLPAGAFKPAGTFSIGDTGIWRTAEFVVDDARFGAQSDGKDIMLFIKSNTDVISGGIYVEKMGARP